MASKHERLSKTLREIAEVAAGVSMALTEPIDDQTRDNLRRALRQTARNVSLCSQAVMKLPLQPEREVWVATTQKKNALGWWIN